LEYVDEEPEADIAIYKISTAFLSASQRAFGAVHDLLSADKYALLSTTGSLGDLFYLPLRVSKILGWIGACVSIARLLGSPDRLDDALAIELCEKILAASELSVVAVSDVQAPYTLLAAEGLQVLGRRDLAESLLSRLLFDFITRRGNIARAHLEPDKVLEFLVTRLSGDFTDSREIVARPTELLPVLLTGAIDLGLAEAVDPHVRDIDHLSLNVYIPDDHRAFARKSMRDGTNLTFQIGSEVGLGVFSVSDFENGFRQYCSPRLARDKWQVEPSVRIGCIMSSLLFPDRVPWLVRHQT
jgi:hypothetical protein